MKKKTFRPDIQGLRALAVLAVIVDHLTGWPGGGFVGVDVFFVISGFLITGLLLREYQRSGRISFVDFYRRRVKRIMPLALLVIVATVVAAYFLFTTPRLIETFQDGVWATFFAANWHFAAAGTDYFQFGGPISPLQHYWSLAVEEQFYFVWPWLMVFILWTAARRANGGEATGRQIVGVAIVVVSVGSFAWAMWETTTNPTWAYFSTLGRAWELGVGAMVALVAPRLTAMPLWARTAGGWAGLAGILVAFFIVPDSNGFPAPWAALPVLSTALVIAAGTGGEQRHLWPLTNPVTNYTGNISYSLYLWHFPVLITLLTVLPGQSFQYVAVALPLTVVLSVASYHLVEDPIRRSFWLEKRPHGSKHHSPRATERKAVSWGWLGVLAVMTTVLASLALQPPNNPAVADYVVPSFEFGDGPTNEEKLPLCLGAASLDTAANCDQNLGTQILPSIDALTEDTGNSYSCFPNTEQPMKSCTYGNASAETKVAVVGDSHAASLLPGLANQVGEQGWNLTTFVGAGCIWSATDSCPSMPQIQQALVAGDFDIVITSAYRGSGSTNKEQQARSFADAWTPVAATGARIVAVADVPGSASEAVACVTRLNFDLASNDCQIPTAAAYRVQDALMQAVARVEGAALVDTRQYFCGQTCPAVIGNVIVYRDDISHISATYSETLGPYLARDIAAAAS
ncbi:acyltransferase [Microbacterium sp. zg.B48]|uniref:acyltransferase family protein n=1 Tax=Microbacterium sp. zg.B48 TaxID=2969408 RepID=UPI00214C321E|nr:acyltransferase family protein [Microbacterium sp. zg.B48]MCR2764221.1 acyltransferase [Microbacterium sp. zg.B48]